MAKSMFKSAGSSVSGAFKGDGLTKLLIGVGSFVGGAIAGVVGSRMTRPQIQPQRVVLDFAAPSGGAWTPAYSNTPYSFTPVAGGYAPASWAGLPSAAAAQGWASWQGRSAQYGAGPVHPSTPTTRPYSTHSNKK